MKKLTKKKKKMSDKSKTMIRRASSNFNESSWERDMKADFFLY